MYNWVVNQDREIAVKLEDYLEFRIELKYLENVYIACNLYYSGILLGTFDSLIDCIGELKRIIRSKEGIVFISI